MSTSDKEHENNEVNPVDGVTRLEKTLEEHDQRIKALTGALTGLGVVVADLVSSTGCATSPEQGSEPETVGETPEPETETKVEAAGLPKPNADHYEYTGETKTYIGETIYRIRSKIARPHLGVKAGAIGGWIGLNATLGECAWIAHDAVACDYASVLDAAELRFCAVVSGYGRVQGNALVTGNAVVEDKALVSDKARVCVSARVSGSAAVTGYAVVQGQARVMGNAVVGGDARVMDNARVCGSTKLGDNVIVSGESLVHAPITITNSTIRDTRICAEPSRGGDNDE